MPQLKQDNANNIPPPFCDWEMEGQPEEVDNEHEQHSVAFSARAWKPAPLSQQKHKTERKKMASGNISIFILVSRVDADFFLHCLWSMGGWMVTSSWDLFSHILSDSPLSQFHLVIIFKSPAKGSFTADCTSVTVTRRQLVELHVIGHYVPETHGGLRSSGKDRLSEETWNITLKHTCKKKIQPISCYVYIQGCLQLKPKVKNTFHDLILDSRRQRPTGASAWGTPWAPHNSLWHVN